MFQGSLVVFYTSEGGSSLRKVLLKPLHSSVKKDASCWAQQLNKEDYGVLKNNKYFAKYFKNMWNIFEKRKEIITIPFCLCFRSGNGYQRVHQDPSVAHVSSISKFTIHLLLSSLQTLHCCFFMFYLRAEIVSSHA